jgi:molybdate transport system substrate-binding protein
MRLPLLLLLLLAPGLAAAELRVLSAGAVEPGLAAALRGFTGEPLQVEYATAPRLAERIAGGERPDLVIAPLGLLGEWQAAGRVAGAALPIGRVGIGAVVKPGSPEPAITDAASLAAALRAAPAIVINRASTGQAMERLFDRLGLAAELAPKLRRHPTGAAVLEDVLHAPEAALGFAAETEITLVPALRALGPLPPGLQNTTAYGAAVPPGGGGAALLDYLGGAEARAAFTAAGIHP